MYSHMSRQKSMRTALKRTTAWNTSARASWDSIWVVSGFQASPKPFDEAAGHPDPVHLGVGGDVGA